MASETAPSHDAVTGHFQCLWKKGMPCFDPFTVIRQLEVYVMGHACSRKACNINEAVSLFEYRLSGPQAGRQRSQLAKKAAGLLYTTALENRH